MGRRETREEDPHLFPELGRVRQYAFIGRLPALSWGERQSVCRWVREMESWRESGAGPPPAPPARIFDGSKDRRLPGSLGWGERLRGVP